MTPKGFTAGWLVAAALLSSWAVSFASDEQRPVPARAGGSVRPVDDLPPLSVELDAEINRLSARALELPRGVFSGTRDPFRFGMTRVERAAPRRAAAETAPADTPRVEPAPVVRAPEPSLSGLAEIAGGTMTAVISFRDELHFLKKGDVLASRYRVDAIAPDAVELYDLVLEKPIRLSLRTMIVQSAVYFDLMR